MRESGGQNSVTDDHLAAVRLSFAMYSSALPLRVF